MARGVWEVMITLPFFETHLTGVNRLSSSCDLGLCLHLGVLVDTEKWLGHSKHLLFPQQSWKCKMRILETKLIVFHFHGRKSKLWNKIEEMKNHNYMQQTIPIQSWKEGWSARLSWRRCWRPWMDPARLKKQGGTHKLRTKYVYIYIYVDQRWELLAVLLQVFGLKKLLWMYDYLKILPSSHIALCKISQIFLWTVFVIINTFCWDPTLGVGQSYRPNISLSDHQTFSIFWCHAWMAFEGRFSSVSCDTRCMLNTLPSVQFSSFVKHFF